MLSVIVAGRNDDYGKDFKERLFRTAFHNCGLLQAAGIDFEYILAEWNPVPGNDVTFNIRERAVCPAQEL